MSPLTLSGKLVHCIEMPQAKQTDRHFCLPGSFPHATVHGKSFDRHKGVPYCKAVCPVPVVIVWLCSLMFIAK
jgi:hypothetical protein